jgi:outer membrane protein assembly factor BamB
MHRSFRLVATATILGSSAAFAPPAASAQDVDQAWLDRYDGPAHRDDYAESMVVDSAGNAYTVGFTFVEVEQGLFVPRFLVVKYTPAGAREWVRTLATGSASAGASVAALDSEENLIVGGFANGSEDWMVLKYAPDGTLLWQRTYEANSWFLTEPADVAIDSSNAVYVTGYIGLDDYQTTGLALVKISAAGAIQWSRQYAGSTAEGAAGQGVAIDAEGNVYVAGSAVVPNRASDALVVKYDADGTLVWTRTFGRTGLFIHDGFNRIAPLPTGGVVACGVFGSNSAAGTDGAVVALSAGGDTRWADELDVAAEDDLFNALAVAPDGSVTTGGSSEFAPNDHDALIVRYAPDGARLWYTLFAGDGNGTDGIADLAVDSQGNAHAAGVTEPFASADFFLTLRLDAAGGVVWSQQYGGPLDGGSRAVAVGLAHESDVVVAGRSLGSGTGMDALTIRYSQPSNSETAALNSLTMVRGALQSGGVEQLAASDDESVITRSGFGQTFVELHSMDLLIGASTELAAPESIDLRIETGISHDSGTMQVRLRDWATNAFTTIASRPLGAEEAVHDVFDIPAGAFVSDAGAIDLSIKQLVFIPIFAYRFDSRFDHVEIVVRE